MSWRRTSSRVSLDTTRGVSDEVGRMHRVTQEMGWIEVICGPMFSGKTEELIRRVNRARLARQHVQIFKPRIDDRYHAERVVSHSRQSVDSVPVKSAADISAKLDPATKVVAIDEAQFFDAEIVRVCEDLANSGLRVLVAGLDQDYLGEPFEPMPRLLAVAEYVTKQLAICMVCGRPAGRSQRVSGGEGRVEVGAAEAYEARCRSCYRPDDAKPWTVIQGEIEEAAPASGGSGGLAGHEPGTDGHPEPVVAKGR